MGLNLDNKRTYVAVCISQTASLFVRFETTCPLNESDAGVVFVSTEDFIYMRKLARSASKERQVQPRIHDQVTIVHVEKLQYMHYAPS